MVSELFRHWHDLCFCLAALDFDLLNVFLCVDSGFGSTLKTSLVMKKVYVVLGIPAKYREWR